jgi:YidC/Oxa1 family membrane protein insertase
MDKRTLPIIIVCMLALFGVQFIVNKLYPPIPKKGASLSLTNQVAGADPAAPAVITNIVEAAPVRPVEAAPVQNRPAEETLVLSNAAVRVEFTSWGGGIKSVELLQHKSYQGGNTFLNGAPYVPALALTDVPGAGTNDVFTLEARGADTVVLRAGGVTKTITLSNDYTLTGTIELPAARGNVTVNVGAAAIADIKEPPMYLVVDWRDASKFWNRRVDRVEKRVKKGEPGEPIQSPWVAVKSQYFTMFFTSPTNAVAVSYAAVDAPRLPGQKPNEKHPAVTAAVTVPVTIGDEGRARVPFSFYTGPKDYGRLAAFRQGQEQIMDFGTPMDFYSGIFGWLLQASLTFFHGLIPNYGVAILLVTLVLKIVFWPIQAKSIESMKQMQKFQPQMQKLREKYKDDAQRMNTEMMKLYKEHKINPLSGCLPMVVQLPVLIAFYRVLISDIHLRGASFLWIRDLSQPDTAAHVFGLPINPLPLLMVAGMIWQQKITPTTGDPQQAKMMMFMPLFMLLFFYNVAAGLTLYWTLQQLLSMLQQWHSMRQNPAPVGSAPTGKTK